MSQRIKAKIVEWGEDFKVRIVTSGEDLQIEPVRWGEEKKVKIVQWGEDKRAKLIGNQFFGSGISIDAGHGQKIELEKNVFDRDFTLRLPDGSKANLGRDIFGEWTLRFADGSKGKLTKDFFGDDWTVRAPDGSKLTLSKDYFGKGWTIRGQGLPGQNAASQPKPEPLVVPEPEPRPELVPPTRDWSGAAPANGAPPAQEHLAEFRANGDEQALVRAWSAATSDLQQPGVQPDALADRFETAAEVALAFFAHIGGFAWLDGGIEMLRRAAALRRVPPDPATRWSIEHAEWSGAVLQRALPEEAWTIFHPDGRISQILGKDWSGWKGDSWPMGWTIRTPDGSLRTFEEDQFGDGWVEAGPVSELQATGRITGSADLDGARYLFTATPDGVAYQPCATGNAEEREPLYLTDFRENTLQDVITKVEPDLFRVVTGLTVEDFNLLVQLKVFNTEQMNQAVFAFRRYEDASLRYTGIDSHPDLTHYGLYDTVVARDYGEAA